MEKNVWSVFFFVLGTLLFARTHGQVDSVALRFSGTITKAELRGHLEVLASDSFLGRDTGKEGQKMAAAYLKKSFMEAGIPPVPAPDPESVTEGYYQTYELLEVKAGSIRMEANGEWFDYKKELVYFNAVLTSDMAVEEVVYLGDASRMPGFPLVGRTVLIDAALLGDAVSMLDILRSRMEVLRAASAAVVLVSVPDFPELLRGLHLPRSTVRLADAPHRATTPPSGLQMILMDATAVDRVLGSNSLTKLAKKRKPRSVHFGAKLVVGNDKERLTAENVMAYIEGSDKKDEVLVLTAHYDHIGVEDGVVYNGADDDGTGTVAIIEIAQAFAEAKAAGHGPRRSILVMPVSGEEKGLLGSRYYSEHPVFPLERTVADLNIDMIGRRDSAHSNSRPYIYVIGSDRLSSELHAANESANTRYTGLDLDYRFNAEDDPNRFYYRSDHYNFARKGVPSIFYFSGVHEDYHQPGDDVEKIDFDLLHQRTLLVFHTAWILANQEQRIAVDKPVGP